MADDIYVQFLGTSSGGGPTDTRNCSSLVIDAVGDGSLLMVDCAEGTVRQFMQQPHPRTLKITKVKKIFITHMHADHVMGIVPLLRNVLYPPPIEAEHADAGPSTLEPPTVELYGPAGLRAFVRGVMHATLTRTAHRYAVHELLRPGDAPTPGAGALHESEAPGADVPCGPDGHWRTFAAHGTARREVVVDAGAIAHRAPSLGFVFRETRGAGARTLAILGDTHDAAALLPLAAGAALLVHEATDAHIPRGVDPAARRTRETVEAKVLARGHSTPAMAGAAARACGAQRLVLNHIGARFGAPRGSAGGNAVRAAVIREIERQASEAWGAPGRRARAAHDYMRVVIPPAPVEDGEEDEEDEEEYEDVLWEAGAGGHARGHAACGRARGRGGGRGRGRGGAGAGARGHRHDSEGGGGGGGGGRGGHGHEGGGGGRGGRESKRRRE